jgi:hypothetical protein
MDVRIEVPSDLCKSADGLVKRTSIIRTSEVLLELVLGAAFKAVGPYVKRAVGGFDSHSLPPFFSLGPRLSGTGSGDSSSRVGDASSL